MIDPKEVLALADRWVEHHHQYSAAPSTDPMMVGLVEAICAKVNAQLGDLYLGVLTVLSFAHADADPQAYNYAVSELAKALGIQPLTAAPPSSGSSPSPSST